MWYLFFYYVDNMVNRGGSFVYWEVFKQWKEIGVFLQVLTEDLDGALVIDSSYYCAHMSFGK